MTTRPVSFSEHFNVDEEKLAEIEAFNPILNFDTKLFVEPLLLKDSSSPVIRSSLETYNKFFKDLLLLLKLSKEEGDKCWREAKSRVHFPEYKSTCIGYGSGSINGSGSGAELNDKILHSAKEIIDLAKESPEIFQLLPLLEKGVGADIISDMTQTIIDDDICKYTVDVMEKLGVEGTYSYKTAKNTRYLLPYNPYYSCPIKLLPSDILSNLPLADTFDDWIVDTSSVNRTLRDAINAHIGDTWFKANKEQKKESILELIKTEKDFFFAVLKTLKENSFEHYDVNEDYQGLRRWLEDSDKLVNITDIEKITLVGDSQKALFQAVEAIIIQFKNLIEDEELWRIFWTKYGSGFRHVNELYSQMLFCMSSKNWLAAQDSNVSVDKELNKETKQINFIFSVSKECNVTVQIKHANNSAGLQLLYDKQHSLYNEGKSEKSFYVVMNFDEKRSKQFTSIKENEKPDCKIIEIRTCIEDSQSSMDLDGVFAGFEGVDLADDHYKDEKSRGGINRHKNTNIIKNNIIKPIFLAKRQGGPKRRISEISSSIIKELNSIEGLDSQNKKTKKFMETYSFNDFEEIELTAQYLKEHNDGGQIQEWCYQISQGKL